MIVFEGFVQFPERNAPDGDWAEGPWIGGDRVIERLEALTGTLDYTLTIATRQVLADVSGVLWVAGGDADGAPEIRVEPGNGRREVDMLEVLRRLDGQHVTLLVTVAP